MLMLILLVVAVSFVTVVDCKPKISKKLANGRPADTISDLANYLKAIAFINGYSATEINYPGCTGFFVEIKPSNVGSNENNPTRGYFVSAGHCYSEYIAKGSTVEKGKTSSQLLKYRNGPKMAIYFGNVKLEAAKKISINMTQYPVRIHKDFDSQMGADCFVTHDVSILELPYAAIEEIKSSNGRFLTLDDISTESGLTGEDCWIAGFGGDLEEYQFVAQAAYTTFFNDDSVCFEPGCDTQVRRNWQFCHDRIDSTPNSTQFTEVGDSGSPVWCMRGGTYKVVGVHVGRLIHKRVAAAMKGVRVRELLEMAYKDQCKSATPIPFQ